MAISGILNIKSIYAFCLMVVVMVLPWSFNLCGYAIIITSLVGLFSTDFIFKKNQITNNIGILAFIIFYCLYLIGYFYSTEAQEGINSLEQKIFLLIIPVIIATSAPLDIRSVQRILLAFVISNFILSLTMVGLSIVDWIAQSPLTGNFDHKTHVDFISKTNLANPLVRFGYISFTHNFIHPTYFSVFLVFCIAIQFISSIAIPQYIKWTLSIWFSIIVVLLASRIGIVLLGLVSIYTISKIFDNKVKAFVTSFTVSALLILITFLSPVTRYRLVDEPLSTSLNTSTTQVHWNSTNLRLMEWQSGLQGIQSAGLFGTGTGATWPTIQKFSSQFNLGVFNQPFNLHNQYLETFLEIGLAGFITLLAIYFIPIRLALKEKRNLLMSLMIIVGLVSVTESFLERAHGVIFFATFVSILTYQKQSIDSLSK